MPDSRAVPGVEKINPPSGNKALDNRGLTIRSFNDQTSDLTYQSQAAIQGNDMGEYKRLDQERRAKDASAHEYNIAKLKDLRQKQTRTPFYEDNSANIKMFESADSVVMNRMNADKQGDAKAASEARLAKDQEAQRVAADIEAKKQASYKAEQTTEEQHIAGLKATHIVSAAEEMNYLKTRSAIVAQGSQEYLQLLKRIGDLNQQSLKEGVAAASKAKQDEYRNTMAGFEQLLAGQQRGGEMVPREVELFWERMQAQTAKGSLAWLDINRRVGEAHQRTMKALREQLQRDGEETLKLDEDVDKGMDRWKADSRKAQQERFEGSDQVNLIQARAAAELSATKIQEASGVTMSRVAAARAVAASNTALYTQELQTLERQLDRVAKQKTGGEGDITESEKQKQTDQVQDQIAQLNGQRTVQQMKDQNDIKPPNSSAMVGLADATETLTRQFLDSASQVRSLFTEAIGDVNKSLLDLITTRSGRGHHEHIFADLGHNLASKAAGVGLERVEGKGLSALTGIFDKKDGGAASAVSKLLGIGGGKAPTGTAGDPLHVITQSERAFGNLATSAPSISNFLPKLGGSSAMSTVSKFLGAAASIPFFANGTDYAPGGPAWVGERGPELMNLPRGASIIPNHKVSDYMGSGGGDTHFHIDARGSTDPAQTMAMVRRGIMEAAPHLISASVHRVHDNKRRSIGGGR